METVWNNNGNEDANGLANGAGGGGCSTTVSAPGWQSSLSSWASAACGRAPRGGHLADSDHDAGDRTYDGSDYCGAGCATYWATFGGTSLASPIIAAMYALTGGAQGVAYPALTLYGHLGSSSLYDVTSGGNGWCDGDPADVCADPNTYGYGVMDCDYTPDGSAPSAGDAACDAGAGYDGPTGVGTPSGLGAFAKLSPTASVTGPSSVTPGVTNAWTASASDPFPGGGNGLSYSWNWGDGSSSTTSSGSATHAFASAGNPSISVTVTDAYGQTASAGATTAVIPTTASVSPAVATATSVSAVATCAGAAGATCTITATLSVTETLRSGKVIATTARRRRKPKTVTRTVILGTATITVTAGQTAPISVTLGGPGPQLLRSRHALSTDLTTTLEGSGLVSSQTVRFTEPKKKHKKR